MLTKIIKGDLRDVAGTKLESMSLMIIKKVEKTAKNIRAYTLHAIFDSKIALPDRPVSIHLGKYCDESVYEHLSKKELFFVVPSSRYRDEYSRSWKAPKKSLLGRLVEIREFEDESTDLYSMMSKLIPAQLSIGHTDIFQYLITHLTKQIKAKNEFKAIIRVIYEALGVMEVVCHPDTITNYLRYEQLAGENLTDDYLRTKVINAIRTRKLMMLPHIMKALNIPFDYHLDKLH